MERNDVILKIGELATQAMLYELFTTPSFGLVTPYSKGSHNDMDYYTFIDSIAVLSKYMIKFADVSYSDIPYEELYNKAVEIGIECENDMFKKTNGVNTHKGLIFVLGSLISAVMKTLFENKPFNNIFLKVKEITTKKMIELTNASSKTTKSYGEEAFIKYRITGVRGEITNGCPTIRSSLNLIDLDKKRTFSQALLYIISQCDDTNIIHRKGITTLNFIKSEAGEIYKGGFIEESITEFNKKILELQVSPGGSADLLCGAIFMKLIEREICFGEVENE